MGLTLSIARAVWQGVFTRSTPFFRTPKCEDKAAFTKGFLMAKEETMLMLLHWLAAGAVVWADKTQDPEARIWALVLVVQSVPFAAALVTSMMSAMPSLGSLKARMPTLAATHK